ncbi:MAG: HlyD family efflux transporter periplasmic adaptor subunit [Flavobacteriales bacterium]|nr:HlyD family efflux transporter periplasmic adaptor subunit [Flavobacteriales bacterium]
MTKRQIIILSVTLLVFVLIVFRLATGTGGDEQNNVKAGDSSKYVKVHTIKNDTVALYVNGFGRVSSAQNITLSSEVQGLLLPTGFDLKPGQSFSQGQLLFKVNDKEAQLALKARKSSFLNIVATILPDIKLDFPDNAAAWAVFLDKIDLAQPLPELPEFKSNKEKTFLAAKNVLAEYFNIKGDEERIKKYHVYAPFNGSVVDVTAEAGTIVNPGTPIATIIKTVALEVAIPVDPQSAGLLKLGNTAKIFSEDKKMDWNGKVTRIAQNINPNTQSIDVYLSIEHDVKHALYNGMYVEADIYAGEVLAADELPRRSFLNDGQVFTVVDSMLIKKKPVVIKKNKNSAVIQGLEDGMQVVIEPIPGAVDSMKVSPILK